LCFYFFHRLYYHREILPQQGFCPYELRTISPYVAPAGSASGALLQSVAKPESNTMEGCTRPQDPNSRKLFEEWDTSNSITYGIKSDMTGAYDDWELFRLNLKAAVIISGCLMWGVVGIVVPIGMSYSFFLEDNIITDENKKKWKIFATIGTFFQIVFVWLSIKLDNYVTNTEFRNVDQWQPFFPSCKVEITRRNPANYLTVATVFMFISIALSCNTYKWYLTLENSYILNLKEFKREEARKSAERNK
jgi:hypothetical protein